jgi:ABC-type Fe3+ transport system permease subunit
MAFVVAGPGNNNRKAQSHFSSMNWTLLENSFLVSVIAALIALGFGAFAAMCAICVGRSWRRVVIILAVLALAMPPFLATNSWLHFLGEAGVWRKWLPLNIFSLSGGAWVLALLTWPITFFSVLAAWQGLQPSDLESDAQLRGAALIRYLLLPLARPALLAAGVITFVLALNNFAVPAILQVKVFPAETWVRFNTSFDSFAALRLSWPLILVPLLMLLWLRWRSIQWPRLEGPVAVVALRRQLGLGWFCTCATITILICFASLVLPIGQLLSVNRTWTELPGALAAGQLAIWNSAFYAIATATLAVAVSIVLAMRNTQRDVPPRSIFTPLLWLPFLTPGVLLGIGLIAVFNRPGLSFFYQSSGIVILAFLIRYFAPGWTMVSHALDSTDRDLRDVARISGASRWQMLRFVHLPEIGPQVAAAWYIMFLLCLWDVESIVLIVPPGGETIALRIFNLLHYGHNAQVNALCLALLLGALTPLAVHGLWRTFRRFITKPIPLASCALAMAVGCSLCGCRPASSENEVPLQSKTFGTIQIIGTRGVGVGQLNKPRSVTVDGQDNLYVVDMTGRVQKFSSNGVFILSWQMPQTELGKPKGMCRDREGNIIVVEPHYQRVNHFSPLGKLLAQWGERGTNVGQFVLPRAVAVNSRNEIFVSEYSIMERVQKFRWTGTGGAGGPCVVVEQAFGQVGNGPNDFNRPEGLCVDLHDNLYVADSCNHRIQIYSGDGKLLRSHGKAGTGPGELSYPYDICVDAAGRQYVCEFGNSRIQVFDKNDQTIEIIGGPGGEPGRFGNPWGVALDSAGNLYVADSQNHRVQKLVRSL